MVENLTLEKMFTKPICSSHEQSWVSHAVFEGTQLPAGESLCLTPEYSLAGQPITQNMRLTVTHSNKFRCTVCGRDTKKLFDACCFPCFQNSAQADRCVLNPVKCHYALGTCREPEWGDANCYQPHYVYLAYTDKLKVGITRHSQIPIRWIDQGATLACLLARVGSRHQAGLLESHLSSRFADKSHWLKMLKAGNSHMSVSDFSAARQEALELVTAATREPALVAAPTQNCSDAGSITLLSDSPNVRIQYPLWSDLPEKIASMNLDKSPQIQSRILGIKGQYLFLENGVFNVRRHEGYVVACELHDSAGPDCEA